MNSLKLQRRPGMLGGVCSGLGYSFGVNVGFVRVVFCVLALANGLGLGVYGLFWWLMPSETLRESAGGAPYSPGAAPQGAPHAAPSVTPGHSVASMDAQGNPALRRHPWLGYVVGLVSAGVVLTSELNVLVEQVCKLTPQLCSAFAQAKPQPEPTPPEPEPIPSLHQASFVSHESDRVVQPQPQPEPVRADLSAALSQFLLRADQALITARASSDFSGLSAYYAGKALDALVAELQKNAGTPEVLLEYVLESRVLHGVNLNSDSTRMVVQLTETWTITSRARGDGSCLSQISNFSAPQTLTLQTQGDGWRIVEITVDARTTVPEATPCTAPN